MCLLNFLNLNTIKQQTTEKTIQIEATPKPANTVGWPIEYPLAIIFRIDIAGNVNGNMYEK